MVRRIRSAGTSKCFAQRIQNETWLFREGDGGKSTGVGAESPILPPQHWDQQLASGPSKRTRAPGLIVFFFRPTRTHCRRKSLCEPRSRPRESISPGQRPAAERRFGNAGSCEPWKGDCRYHSELSASLFSLSLACVESLKWRIPLYIKHSHRRSYSAPPPAS